MQESIVWNSVESHLQKDQQKKDWDQLTKHSSSNLDSTLWNMNNNKKVTVVVVLEATSHSSILQIDEKTDKKREYNNYEKQNFVFVIARILLIVFLCTPFFNGGYADDFDVRLKKPRRNNVLYKRKNNNNNNNTTKPQLLLSFWKELSNSSIIYRKITKIEKMQRRRRREKKRFILGKSKNK